MEIIFAFSDATPISVLVFKQQYHEYPSEIVITAQYLQPWKTSLSQCFSKKTWFPQNMYRNHGSYVASKCNLGPDKL